MQSRCGGPRALRVVRPRGLEATPPTAAPRGVRSGAAVVRCAASPAAATRCDAANICSYVQVSMMDELKVVGLKKKKSFL